MSKEIPPYLPLPGAWDRVGLWYGGMMCCSRGDCPHYSTNAPSIPTRRAARRCMHPDGPMVRMDVGFALCEPYYRRLQFEYAKLVQIARKP
jgi:hypothetical protein